MLNRVLVGDNLDGVPVPRCATCRYFHEWPADPLNLPAAPFPGVIPITLLGVCLNVAAEDGVHRCNGRRMRTQPDVQSCDLFEVRLPPPA